MVLAKEKFGLRERDIEKMRGRFVPFTAQTRMSGIDVEGKRIRKGSTDAIARWVSEQGGAIPRQVKRTVEEIARSGGTPLVVAAEGEVLGVIHLKEVVF